MSNKHSVEKLSTAINNMDSLSQQGFSEISSIARLTIAAMESPTISVKTSNDDVLHILQVIWGIANDIENCINVEAEGVGCHYVSEATQKRINEALEVNNHE